MWTITIKQTKGQYLAEAYKDNECMPALWAYGDTEEEAIGLLINSSKIIKIVRV